MLKLNEVNFMRNDFQLHNVSLSLPKGYIMGLIGENGAGKTTLIELIMQLLVPQSGNIEIFGLPNTLSNNVAIKSHIGFVYDSFCSYQDMTVDQMAKFLSAFYPKWNDEDYILAKSSLKLDGQKKIKELSKGNQMKAQIILALSHEAKLILMDEPSSGLDPIVRKEMMVLLQKYVQKHHASVLFSTHITSDLENFADYITFLHRGEILFSMDIEHLRDEYKIVKVEKEHLTYREKNQFIGWEENEYFITALVHKDFPFSHGMIVENASIQDIMYFYCR